MAIAVTSLLVLSLATLSTTPTDISSGEQTLTLIERDHLSLSYVRVLFSGGFQQESGKDAGLSVLLAETMKLELINQFPDIDIQAHADYLTVDFPALRTGLSTRTGSLLNRLKHMSGSTSLKRSFRFAKRNTYTSRKRLAHKPLKLLQEGVRKLSEASGQQALPTWGRLSTIKSLEFKAVRNRLRSLASSSSMSVTVSGPKLSKARPPLALAIQKFHTGRQSLDSETVEEASESIPTKSRRILVIDRPGLKRTFVQMFQIDSERDIASVSLQSIVKIAFGELPHGRFGEAIRNQDCQIIRRPLTVDQAPKEILSVTFACPSKMVPRTIKQLEKLWGTLKSEGMSAQELESARAQFSSETLLNGFNGDTVVQLSAKLRYRAETGDRSLLDETSSKALPLDTINRLLHQGVDPRRIQIVILGDASGSLLRAITQLRPKDEVEVISYDALL